MPNQESGAQDFETGIITQVQNGNAIVELNIQPACENCGARVLCVPDKDGKRALKVSNPLNAGVGNRVAISESSDFLLKVSAVQYGIPFIGFLLGIIVLYIIDFTIAGIHQELLFFAGGLAGLGISALISRNISKNMAESNRSFFTITKVIE